MKASEHQPAIFENADALALAAANWMVDCIADTLQKQDRFTLVLSGGSTPQKLFNLLASTSFRERINWEKIHIFWGDERAVPFTDERNNAAMAFRTLLDHVPVKKENIHIMDTTLEPQAAAAAYEKVLKTYFSNADRTFDLVLLGMGDDGHTLSLFPGQENIHERNKWVMAFYLEAQQMYRITLTAPIVNGASRVAFLITGSGKAVALYEVLYGQHDPDRFPSQLIQPYHEKPHWFLDKAAAAELEK